MSRPGKCLATTSAPRLPARAPPPGPWPACGQKETGEGRRLQSSWGEEGGEVINSSMSSDSASRRCLPTEDWQRGLPGSGLSAQTGRKRRANTAKPANRRLFPRPFGKSSENTDSFPGAIRKPLITKDKDVAKWRQFIAGRCLPAMLDRAVGADDPPTTGLSPFGESIVVDTPPGDVGFVPPGGRQWPLARGGIGVAPASGERSGEWSVRGLSPSADSEMPGRSDRFAFSPRGGVAGGRQFPLPAVPGRLPWTRRGRKKPRETGSLALLARPLREWGCGSPDAFSARRDATCKRNNWRLTP